jgi:uncharacterized protein
LGLCAHRAERQAERGEGRRGENGAPHSGTSPKFDVIGSRFGKRFAHGRAAGAREVASRFQTCQNLLMRPSQALASQRSRILALAAARGASRLRVFGSVARGSDHEGSDVDLLVDLPAGTSLLHIVGLQLDIEDALGVKVDLCTERELHPALKQRILAEARLL